MDFHPSQIPIAKVFDLKDEKDATNAAHEMVKIGFLHIKWDLRLLCQRKTLKPLSELVIQ